MELTYEDIKETLRNYFDSLVSIEGEKDIPRISAYFTPDFKIQWTYRSATYVQNREEWVGHLCGHPNEYRAICSYQPPPLGFIIDERKKTATMLITEEFKHPMTGVDVNPKEYIIVHFELCIHENNVKVKRETINTIPMTSIKGHIWGGAY